MDLKNVRVSICQVMKELLFKKCKSGLMLEMGYCNTSHKGIKGEMFISKDTKKVFDKIAYPF